RPWLNPVVEGVTLLGSRAVLIGIMVGLTVWGSLAKRCARSVLIALGVLAATVLLETVLKIALDRPRPEPALHLDAVSTRAFPSGHATSATAVYAFLAVLFGGGKRWLLAGALIVLVGLSRVYLGVHWISDVVGGTLLGSAVAAAGVLLLRGHRLDPSRCAPPHPDVPAS
ncbi:MAG TPA: phosphatase PAP2 family protein, partial [Actinomycetota bacterium]|nr:phosphatase PAP2 family protein [Actinomycetota bacterium]